jgi:hypothetical protein
MPCLRAGAGEAEGADGEATATGRLQSIWATASTLTKAASALCCSASLRLAAPDDPLSHDNGERRTMSQAQAQQATAWLAHNRLTHPSSRQCWLPSPHGTISLEHLTPTLQHRTTPSLSAPHPIAPAMFVQRSAFAVARRAAPRAFARRTFATSFVRRKSRRELPQTMHL